jgi:hypothetical protein
MPNRRGFLASVAALLCVGSRGTTTTTISLALPGNGGPEWWVNTRTREFLFVDSDGRVDSPKYECRASDMFVRVGGPFETVR